MRQQGMRIQWSALAASNDGLAAGSPSELADDLHQLLSDPQVDMVICATGGHTTLPVLPYIDFTLVAQCRKPIVGFSDVTAFLWAALKMSSLITFHGPMVLSEWARSEDFSLYYRIPVACSARLARTDRIGPSGGVDRRIPFLG